MVVEARDRVGGRLLSQSVAGAELDLGATWYWPGETRVTALVEQLRVPSHAQHVAGDAIYHAPGVTQRIDGNPIDVAAHRFSRGAQSLAQAVADSLPPDVLRLAHPADRIAATTDGGVEVECGGSTVTAQHVVLAVPPALAVAHIQFDPELPAALTRVAQATPVWMGAMTKVVACFSSPFWRTGGFAGAAISHAGPLREVHDMSGPEGSPAALFGFAPPTHPNSPTPVRSAILDQLVEMFGPEASAPESLIIHDWRTEPWTAPAGAEALDAYHLYGHPLYQSPELGGRLHWASTETALSFPGHIEGALFAAERASAAVLGSLRGVK